MSAARAPERVRPWLRAPGSLTLHLVRHSHGSFRVELVSQSWVGAPADVAPWLGVRMGQRVWRREVRLCAGAIEWVHAVTWANEAASALLRLDRLGNRSLGTVLFRAGSQRLQKRVLGPAAAGHWARRALHGLPGGGRLIVQEAFLPALPPFRR